MPIDVNVSDKLTCLMVHWNTGLEAAEKQASIWGFRGITNFTKVDVLNGNSAREHVRSTVLSRKGNWRYFWKGNYDWGVGNDSAIYQFDYDLFDGMSITGDGAEWMANYRAPAHTEPPAKDDD